MTFGFCDVPLTPETNYSWLWGYINKVFQKTRNTPTHVWNIFVLEILKCWKSPISEISEKPRPSIHEDPSCKILICLCFKGIPTPQHFESPIQSRYYFTYQMLLFHIICFSTLIFCGRCGSICLTNLDRFSVRAVFVLSDILSLGLSISQDTCSGKRIFVIYRRNFTGDLLWSFQKIQILGFWGALQNLNDLCYMALEHHSEFSATETFKIFTKGQNTPYW